MREGLTWRELPPRQLAYLGDAVWELYVRQQLLGSSPDQDVLHARKVSMVHAPAQARALRALMELLDPDELDVVRRARNLKGSVPRHRSVSDYRHGTAFEALLGKAYLEARPDRLRVLLEHAFATAQISPGVSATEPASVSEESP